MTDTLAIGDMVVFEELPDGERRSMIFEGDCGLDYQRILETFTGTAWYNYHVQVGPPIYIYTSPEVQYYEPEDEFPGALDLRSAVIAERVESGREDHLFCERDNGWLYCECGAILNVEEERSGDPNFAERWVCRIDGYGHCP